MITSGKIREMIKRFETILPYAMDAGAVNMMSSMVSDKERKHKCGTIHCHAGWYVLACVWDRKADYLDGDEVDFRMGADRMEHDLGMGGYTLPLWANDYPEIWGNDDGDMLFYDPAAFGCTKGDITLEKIIGHWRRVADALEVWELCPEDMKGEGWWTRWNARKYRSSVVRGAGW